MDTLSSSFSINRFSLLTPLTLTRHTRLRNCNYGAKNPRFLVFATKDDPKLNQWDLMELKFGKMLGEDPKLTLAKIMGKKLNPDASYMDIEKSFHKNKGKLGNIEEIPLDWAKKDHHSTDSMNEVNSARPVVKKSQSSDSLSGLNLARPVLKKGQSSSALSGLNLPRPVLRKGVKFEAGSKLNPLEINKPKYQVGKTLESAKASVPNVILRKPAVYNENEEEIERTSTFSIKPNLTLKMGRDQVEEKYTDMTLLRKPQPMTASADAGEELVVDGNLGLGQDQLGNIPSDIPLLKKPEAGIFTTKVNEVQKFSTRVVASDIPLSKKPEENGIDTNLIEIQRPPATVEASSDITLLTKPRAIIISPNIKEIQRSSGTTEAEPVDVIVRDSLQDVSLSGDIDDATTNGIDDFVESEEDLFSTEVNSKDEYLIGLQPLEQTTMGFTENKITLTESSDIYVAALQGKPKRLDQSVNERSKSTRVEEKVVLGNLESCVNAELENFLSPSPLKESEDIDWRRAEDLVKTGGREEVELISCSTRGFVASCGSLIGFLPYRNLAARWKFLAFESWLRIKGLDPSVYRQSLGIIGTYDASNKNAPLDSIMNPESDRKSEGDLSPNTKLEELISIYDHEKTKFLSSFVGQRIKVTVLIADRKSRKLIFSIRPKEKEELVERKRSLMAKLSIGDIVKCCIQKITYFGIFVEVEGIPALIHQTEVSWDTTLDPTSYYKIGQIVDAKVYQLDFALERIFLSLKEITSDPLIEALESVVSDANSLDDKLEAAEPDTEWVDVESLVKELEQIDGIQSVSKGRFFLSPGLAPTFQVYMASMFENQYKLLARSENKVQEVIVEASLGKEEMKSAILTCAGRVE